MSDYPTQHSEQYILNEVYDPTTDTLKTSTTGSASAGLEYNTTPPTLVNGGTDTLQGDVNANLKVREQYAPGAEDNVNGVIATARKYVNSSNYSSTYTQNMGAATAANEKSSAGSVVSIRATNANAAARYFQIHNKATAPTAGETALRSYIIPAGSAAAPAVLQLNQDDLGGPVVCATGVSWAISTVATTYTAATAGDHTVNLNYV